MRFSSVFRYITGSLVAELILLTAILSITHCTPDNHSRSGITARTSSSKDSGQKEDPAQSQAEWSGSDPEELINETSDDPGSISGTQQTSDSLAAGNEKDTIKTTQDAPEVAGTGIKGSGDPLAVEYQPKSAYGFYLSEQQNSPGQNLRFSCPGDSFMTGISSAYDKEHQGRSYRFMCQFFTDGTGMPMRKANCNVQSASVVQNTLDYACPDGTFMSGQSQSSRENMLGDYQFECCEMRTHQDKQVFVPRQDESETEGENPLLCSSQKMAIPPQYRSFPQYQPLINQNINERHADFAYSCENAAILRPGGLTVNYQPEMIPHAVLRQISIDFRESDTFFSLYCCGLKSN